MVLKNVLDFLVPFLWLSLAVAIISYVYVTQRRHGVLVALRKLVSYRLLWPLLFIISISVASASLVFIDPKEVGVVVSLLQKKGIREEPIRSGLHWIVPLAEHVERYPIVMQTYTMSGRPMEGERLGDDAIKARTADGQLVIIDISVLYRVDAAEAVNLHILWQDRYTTDLVRPAMRMAVRSEASKYTVDEVNSEKRKVFENSLNTLVKDRCQGSGLEVDAVLVRNITFSPEYALSVEEKMTALQRVTEAAYKAKQIANLANGEAERIRIKARADADARIINAEATATARVVKARAEAEALNMIGVALDKRDNLLTFKYIEKLSPNIRAMLLPSNSPLILPMPELEQTGQPENALPASDIPALDSQPLKPAPDPAQAQQLVDNTDKKTADKSNGAAGSSPVASSLVPVSQ